MNKLTNWIKDNQVISFFIIAFLVTWLGFALVYWIFPGNDLLEAAMAPVVFGPALSAMLISGIAEPQPRHKPTKARWITFLITWIVASIIHALFMWFSWEVQNLPAVIIFSCAFALFPAWMVSSAFARRPGVRKHFSTILKPRGPWYWYPVIFLIFPGVPLLAFVLTRLFGGEAEFYLAGSGVGLGLLIVLLDFLKGFLMTGGINEESGWRGFALPRLQARYPVIVSAGIVWFFWAAWHIPYDLGRGVPMNWMLENRLFWNLIFAILMSWVYNRTNGSILAPALFHPAMNAFGNAFSITLAGRIIFIALTVFAIVYDRMWQKLPADHLAVYQLQEPQADISIN
jgi:membrane protease YdiL (CAAX protease family)